ncbi:uncharacterized protein QC763_504530 [Podospora pseudopauciseta]|uniref:SET domain-containing protein n=1 Tax=Podospora pseudopauciseta TaxID=2093780 RepID=A0ABR0H8Y3_9PEZI|nr:hypothetical protein QC763_504530 [Podospora pseudopauciseta]
MMFPTRSRRKGAPLLPLRFLTTWSLLASSTTTLALSTIHNPKYQCPSSPPPALTPHQLLSASCPHPIPGSLTETLFSNSSSHITPWTHAPVCELTNGLTGQYCTYTNSHHGHRGFSLVTTPSRAADVASWFLDLPLPKPSDGAEGEKYKVVTIPGKGKGVIATKEIKQWEEIILDYATLVVDVGFTVEVNALRGYRLLHKAVEQMGDGGNGVMELGKSSEHAQDVVENVLRTNAFSTRVGEGDYMAVYPTVSVSLVSPTGLLNRGKKSKMLTVHPSSAYTRFIQESLQVSIAASKPISPGEEITISYLTLGKTSSERAHLLKKWGFTCSCPLCTSPPSTIAASDARRKEIAKLQDLAIRAFQANKPYQALRLTRQILPLLPKEELFPLESEQLENMSRIYFVLNDMDKAEKYARLSLEVLARQGYIKWVEGWMVGKMFRRFEEEEGPRGVRY